MSSRGDGFKLTPETTWWENPKKKSWEADTEEFLGWILSFGDQVRVVRPESLRNKVKEEARTIVREG